MSSFRIQTKKLSKKICKTYRETKRKILFKIIFSHYLIGTWYFTNFHKSNWIYTGFFPQLLNFLKIISTQT